MDTTTKGHNDMDTKTELQIAERNFQNELELLSDHKAKLREAQVLVELSEIAVNTCRTIVQREKNAQVAQ